MNMDLVYNAVFRKGSVYREIFTQFHEFSLVNSKNVSYSTFDPFDL